MSLKYVDQNGASHVVSGMTPGGNLETGAVATRTGTTETITIQPNNFAIKTITFSEPMPDNDYLIELEIVQQTRLNTTVYAHCNSNKTANGFQIWICNPIETEESVIIKWTAFKLYDVADAEQLYSKVTDMEAMVPSNASSTNKFATINDLTGETRPLDRRLDDVEDVIPNTATISNKLATAADVAEAMANAGLKVVDTIPTAPENNDVILYVGATTEDYEKGGIYQYNASQAAWVLISKADVDLSCYETSWTGTNAAWEALTTQEKAQYQIVNITDDVSSQSVTDSVTNGDMRPVTSNAVYDLINQIATATVTVSNAKGTLTFKRTGKVVTVFGDLTDVTAATVSLGTAPVGYRPATPYAVGFATEHVSPYPSTGSIWFYIGGNIQLYLPAKGDCYVSATYVTAE